MYEVKFVAGYYEWNLYVDGERVLTLLDEDVSADVDGATYSELENLVDDYIDCVNSELEADGKEPLPVKLKAELKNKMIEHFASHYGIEETAV